MRVISGESKGRRLIPFRGRFIRPTSDKVREAIFNVLASKGFGLTLQVSVLDLFAGSGALGVEALSRGAGKAIFVDNDRYAIRVIERNLSLCGLKERGEVLPINVLQAISILKKRGFRFNIIFLDPPYDKGLVIRTLREVVGGDLLVGGGWIVAEHSKREIPPESLDAIRRMDMKTYGQTVVSFYYNLSKCVLTH